MFRISAGSPGNYGDAVTRRTFVQIGVAGMASVGLSSVLKARAENETATAVQSKKDTSVILLWLDGGPSHLDLYDMKPEAPAEIRGIWRPIKTNVPGIEICEMLPLQAKVADRFSLIRSLHHGDSDHLGGSHLVLTSRDRPTGDTIGQNPSIGSIAAKVCGPRRPGLPPYVAIPEARVNDFRPGFFGGNYLGPQYHPFETGSDPNGANFKVNNVRLADGLTITRLEDRRYLLMHLDRLRREVDASGGLDAMDRFQSQAYQFVTSSVANKAFDIGAEPDALRDRYGRNTWGQSTLLARRLVEAGCMFVTVHMGGWDQHWDLQPSMETHLPKIDMAVSSLLQDLSDSGLSEKVLVVMCGEFSRTPRMNDGGNGGPPLSVGKPGRDHWADAMFVLVAGGGVKGGRVVGATDRHGERPKERPVTPGDLHATIYHVLGVDPSTCFLNRSGRPVPAIDSGTIISELF